MSKKKRNKENISVPQSIGKNSPLSIFYFLIMLVFNIILINRITSNNVYVAYHTSFQLLAYLLIYNLGFLIFYNYNFSIFKKRTLLYLYIGLGLSILYVYIISFYPVLELNGDNAGYLARAQSVLQGKGFRSIWLPQEPFESTLKSIGFSILNMPFILIFGIHNYIGLKLLEFFSVFVGLFFMYKYFKSKMKRDQLFILVLLVAMYSQIIHFSSIIMTESVAFALLFLILYLVDTFIGTPSKLTLKKIVNIILISLLIFITFTVREALIGLFAAIPLYLLIKKRWKEGILTGFFILLPFIGYMILSKHLAHLNIINHLVPQNKNSFQTTGFLSFYFNWAKQAFSFSMIKAFFTALLVASQKILGNPDRTKYTSLILNIIILGTMSLGIYKNIKNKKFYLSDMLFIFMLIIVSFSASKITDVVVVSRYLYPIIAIIFYYFILGLFFIFNFLRKKSLIYSSFLLLISFSLIFSFKMNTTAVYSAHHPYQPAIQHFIDACDWIKNNTVKNTIIASRKSTLAYIWAQRKSMHYFNDALYTRYDKYSQKFETNTLQYYTNNHIQYIILDAFSYDAYYKILPIIKNNMNRFKVLYKTSKPETYVLKFKQTKK